MINDIYFYENQEKRSNTLKMKSILYCILRFFFGLRLSFVPFVELSGCIVDKAGHDESKARLSSVQAGVDSEASVGWTKTGQWRYRNHPGQARLDLAGLERDVK